MNANSGYVGKWCTAACTFAASLVSVVKSLSFELNLLEMKATRELSYSPIVTFTSLSEYFLSVSLFSVSFFFLALF